jgi:hypothetical protein
LDFELGKFSPAFDEMIEQQAVNEIMELNDDSSLFGLSLTAPEARSLVRQRALSLKNNGRIEFGSGLIEKIILAFYDSPYLSRDDYAETLHGLIEIFYYYKNETLDQINDDELISFMKDAFDGICQGSLQLLASREMERFAENIRFGRERDFQG